MMDPKDRSLNQLKKYLPYRPEIFIQRAIQIFKKSHGRPLFLFMSGGIDSEFVGHFLLLAEVAFTPLIVRYENGYNDYDINWAKLWCNRNSLAYVEVLLPLEKFLNSAAYQRILKQIEIRRPFNPSLFPVFKPALEAGFSCISGCGEPSISIEPNGLFEHIAPQGNGLLRWAKNLNHSKNYTEFLRDKNIKALFLDSARVLQKKSSRQWSCEELKALIYQNHFDYVPRPKFNGFEFIVIQRPGVISKLCPPGFTYIEKMKPISD